MRNSDGTVPLQTERLFLRRFTLADAPAIYTGWAQDTAVTRYLRWNPHQSLAETKALVKNWCCAYEEEPDFYNWAICRSEDGALLGSIGVMPCDTGLSIGYALRQRVWGQGYATEAVRAATAHLIGFAGISALWGIYASENAASGRVLEKCGFVYNHDASYESFDHTRQFACRCCLLQPAD